MVTTSDSAQVVWSFEQDTGKPGKGRWRAVGLSPDLLKVVEAGTKTGAALRRVRCEVFAKKEREAGDLIPSLFEV